MRVASFNGCKVYDLSSAKSFPQWLSESKRRSLTSDESYRRRLELIQDFEMNTASQCIRMSSDHEHIIVTGVYPPSVRCYTVSDLAMKFQRGLTSEVIALETLTNDFGKLAFLQTDRTISFHAPYGSHYSLRIPTFGRHMKYNPVNCDLLVASSSNEIYRLNLESGQFKEPFSLSYNGCNKLDINPLHQLLGCGGDEASCEFWDTRLRKSVAKIDLTRINSYLDTKLDVNSSITALKFDKDGLTLGLGTSLGHAILFDIRSSKPLIVKEHQYGVPMVDISFHNSTKQVISIDSKIVKIWDRSTGDILTNIETPADINDVLCVNDTRGETGMLMLAGEQSKLMTYFIPQLGPAPRWCSFLESITEELEETAQQTVYEDFKFVTRTELDELGAVGLIGTDDLKAYMHGYFMDMKVYSKLRAVSKPFEYEEHRKKLLQKKIESKRESRITPRRRTKAQNRSNTSVDPRFSSLLDREEFTVDKESEHYKLRNPVKSNRKEESDDDLSPVKAIKSNNEEQLISVSVVEDSYWDEVDSGEDQILNSSKKITHKNTMKKMFTSSLSNLSNKSKRSNDTLSQRLRQEQHKDIKTSNVKIRTILSDKEDGIVREISFIPNDQSIENKKMKSKISQNRGMKREEMESFASMNESFDRKNKKVNKFDN